LLHNFGTRHIRQRDIEHQQIRLRRGRRGQPFGTQSKRGYVAPTLNEKSEQLRRDHRLVFNQQDARWIFFVQPVAFQRRSKGTPIKMVFVRGAYESCRCSTASVMNCCHGIYTEGITVGSCGGTIVDIYGDDYRVRLDSGKVDDVSKRVVVPLLPEEEQRREAAVNR
jgi:hypothetical protein